jgi:hypothetical protein
MTRTFQDRNFLVWEVFPSGGRRAYASSPHLIFHCLTQRDIRPRYLAGGSHEADAERHVADVTDAELLEMLERAQDIP